MCVLHKAHMPHMNSMIYAACLCLLALLSANATPTKHGVAVQVQNRMVELAVGSASSFRVSVSVASSIDGALDSTMLPSSRSDYASFSIVTPNSSTVGIKTAFGQVSIDSTSSMLQLSDAQGAVLSSAPLFSSSDVRDVAEETYQFSKNDSCANVDPGTDCSSPVRTPSCPNGLADQTQATCCAACNADADCQFWVYATSNAREDLLFGNASRKNFDAANCWLLQSIGGLIYSSDRVMGTAGKFPPGPPRPPPTQTLQLGQSATAMFYGAGGAKGSPLTNTQVQAYVTNTAFYTSHFWSTDGFAALGVSAAAYDTSNFAQYPSYWQSTSDMLQWRIQGSQVDLYLMPAATMATGMQVYWELIGTPLLPPKYAFGFLACRWGWNNESYIESTLQQFRNGSYPIDAWISDFTWYTPYADYTLPNSGSPTFDDFGYNPATFPNPVAQLKHYREDLHLRFGGIRKPRLGNSALLTLAHDNGWLVGQFGVPNATSATRNLNYSIPALRQWYGKETQHFLPDGVAFYWNDEGETMYFTFNDWNLAELEILRTFDATRRFFTISRSYSPGMQRLGGTAVWTGDIPVTWQALEQTPGTMLNWILAGVGYVTCDTGGFAGPDSPPPLLTRWYQTSTFMSVMRVHSVISAKPHFPFLYPEPYSSIMRSSMDLRYALLPHHYSRALEQRMYGKPWIRPLVMDYPSDSKVAELTTQWFDGEGFMVAPILTSADGTNSDTSRAVYLPEDTWHQVRWGGALGTAFMGTLQGPQTYQATGVSLNVSLTFVKAGTILLTGPVLQYTDLQPGGPLMPIVFAGADGTVSLLEDDGATTTSPVRQTVFSYSDASSTLSWKVANAGWTGEQQYTMIKATKVDTDGSTRTASVLAIGSSGSVTF